MITLRLVLMILAFICLFLSALNVVAPRLNLMGLGLTFWILGVIVQ